MDFRIGYGWDSHEFEQGRPLFIGGVELKHERGLAGHSDGDVLLHAICDALLGALALDDIGAHFPCSDPAWRNAESSAFLRHALRLVRERGWAVANLDSTVILNKPHLHPHRTRLRSRIAELLEIDVERVSVKAKTPEGMGTDDAAIAHAVVLLGRS